MLSIKLRIKSTITIFSTNGSTAGVLPPGTYIAEPNTGQQHGWFSIYDANRFYKKINSTPKLANVYLSYVGGKILID